MDLSEVIDPHREPKRCIVIAIDGARRDYVERYDAPWLNRLAAEGVLFRNAIASNGLAETANGFATIATGVTTSEHGVCTSRDWYDRDAGKLVYVYDEMSNTLRLAVPTAAEQIKARRPGVRIASISTKDRLAVILGGGAADLVAYCYREHVFHRHVRGSYTGAGVTDDGYQYSERSGHRLPSFLENLRVARRVHWMGPGFEHPDRDVADTGLIDQFIMDGALAIAEHFDPEILFVGLVGPNIVGHQYGPVSLEMAESFRIVDEQIGRLVRLTERRGARADTLFIVTSDHGMSLKPGGIDITTQLRERLDPRLMANILYTFCGAVGGLYLKDTNLAAIEAMVTAVRTLQHLRGAWWKYDPAAPWFVKRVAHPHTPDILVVPERSWVILDPGVTKPNVIAHHGPPYPSDVSIVHLYSGAGIKRLGPIGQPFDLERNELLTAEEIAGLPEHRDVATLMLKMFGAS